MMAVVDQHSLGGYMMAVVVVEPSLSLPVLSSVKAYLFQLFAHFSLKSIVYNEVLTHQELDLVAKSALVLFF